jgi:hypothetical protein
MLSVMINIVMAAAILACLTDGCWVVSFVHWLPICYIWYEVCITE